MQNVSNARQRHINHTNEFRLSEMLYNSILGSMHWRLNLAIATVVKNLKAGKTLDTLIFLKMKFYNNKARICLPNISIYIVSGFPKRGSKEKNIVDYT